MALGDSLAGMESGEEREISHEGTGKKFKVRYTSEQALGDDNLPAPGYTVGHYHVHGPGEGDYQAFRHSPHGPTLMGAKPYAAEQAARHITGSIRAQRRDKMFNDRRGQDRD